MTRVRHSQLDRLHSAARARALERLPHPKATRRDAHTMSVARGAGMVVGGRRDRGRDRARDPVPEPPWALRCPASCLGDFRSSSYEDSTGRDTPYGKRLWKYSLPPFAGHESRRLGTDKPSHNMTRALFGRKWLV